VDTTAGTADTFVFDTLATADTTAGTAGSAGTFVFDTAGTATVDTATVGTATAGTATVGAATVGTATAGTTTVGAAICFKLFSFILPMRFPIFIEFLFTIIST
jgi:hypothetical protein